VPFVVGDRVLEVRKLDAEQGISDSGGHVGTRYCVSVEVVGTLSLARLGRGPPAFAVARAVRASDAPLARN